jgi:hypothetical protein
LQYIGLGTLVDVAFVDFLEEQWLCKSITTIHQLQYIGLFFAVAIVDFLEEQWLCKSITAMHPTQYILQITNKSSKTSRLQQHMQSNAHLHEFDELIHACENNSATNYIRHTIHLPAVRAVHLMCDVI